MPCTLAQTLARVGATAPSTARRRCGSAGVENTANLVDCARRSRRVAEHRHVRAIARGSSASTTCSPASRARRRDISLDVLPVTATPPRWASSCRGSPHRRRSTPPVRAARPVRPTSSRGRGGFGERRRARWRWQRSARPSERVGVAQKQVSAFNRGRGRRGRAADRVRAELREQVRGGGESVPAPCAIGTNTTARVAGGVGGPRGARGVRPSAAARRRLPTRRRQRGNDGFKKIAGSRPATAPPSAPRGAAARRRCSSCEDRSRARIDRRPTTRRWREV